MASEQAATSVLAPPPSAQVSPLQAWVARLGLSGKILVGGGLVGVIAVFLPLLSMSMQIQSFGGKGGFNVPAVNSSHSVMVVGDFRGVICLVGYAAVLALSWVLYPPNGLAQKSLGWAGVGVGAFITVLALWLLALAYNGSAGVAGFGGSFQVSVGIGAIFNLLAGGTVAAGGFLKAREEKLI